ncbi:unnamed protein product [Haemonchus placei]|uniref:AAA_11 domain-containing protein n=1 Tax=Haemonchus placei TaxID=6290 RepID=A0A0N4WBA2_HAEPC|nr:unnamed protein product [Haemonchus placei]
MKTLGCFQFFTAWLRPDHGNLGDSQIYESCPLTYPPLSFPAPFSPHIRVIVQSSLAPVSSSDSGSSSPSPPAKTGTGAVAPNRQLVTSPDVGPVRRLDDSAVLHVADAKRLRDATSPAITRTGSIAVRLVVPAWGYNYAVRTASRFAITRDDAIAVDVCVKLESLPSGAKPLYELISQHQLFGRFDDDSLAAIILDTVYGTRVTPLGSAGPQPKHVYVSVHGRSFPLRSDQIAALQMDDRHLLILAIQAAFGTGKTLIAALIAIRTHLVTAEHQQVIATTMTNTAAAQFTDTA